MTGRRALALALLALLAGAAGDAWAQRGGSLTGGRPPPAGSDAYLQRQLRTLDRSRASPGSAEILLRRTQRDLVTQSRGVYLTPEQARVQRDLDRIERDRRDRSPGQATLQPPARPRGERLPGSIDDTGALPSMGGTLTLGRLVGRAETALADGRTAQARSDLATARALVGGVQPQGAAEAAELADIQARMGAVERRLAGEG